MFAKSQLAFLTLSVLSSIKDSLAAPIALRNSNLARASIGNFGKCSVPQIKFGVGFDNRKETSFEPADLKSYNHGSAQNIDIITQFICDQLVNSCGADQTAKNTCATAKAKADTGAAKTGVQADLFNGVFGIKTNFAAVASVDDQGRVVAGTGSASSTASSGQAASNNAGSASTGAASSGSASTGSAASSSGIGNFGSCSVPQIKFGVGFDNRKETSFEPADLKSYNHGSAQNIDIITQFICDQLVNSCGADQTAKNTCATAKAKADTGAAKTGVQADLFNGVFGIKTNFAAVASVDDQGRVVAGTGSSSSAASSGQALVNAGAAGAAASSSGIGNFGKCSVPQIQFAVGFDNRKETSFEPVDLKSYNHGSAQNIDIITQFICDQLVNSCGADQTAKNTCATAKAKADTGAAKTGVQADLFNGVFGIKTNFAAVASVDDQGRVVAGTGSGSAANNAGAATATAAATITAAATAASVDATAAAIAALSAEGSLPPVLNKAASIAIAGAAADAAKESAALASLAGATAANNAGAGAAAGAATTAAVATATAAASNASGNLQKFKGALGGITPPAVTNIGKGQFQVDGNSAFNNLQNALVRSCDVQHNKCANAANASGNKGALTVNACGTQQTQCNAQAQA